VTEALSRRHSRGRHVDEARLCGHVTGGEHRGNARELALVDDDRPVLVELHAELFEP
jgi:hypothetical protein